MSRLYIYRIINTITKQVYIGQSSAQGHLTRIFDHFDEIGRSGHTTAVKKRKESGEQKFFRECLGYGLMNVEIQIFDEAQNFGFTKELFENFFSMWTPGEKTVRNVEEGSVLLEDSKLSIHQYGQPKKMYNKLQVLDAAEILHILNAENSTGCEVVNQQMGGQTTAWYFAKGGSKTRQLTRSDTPAEAKRIFSTCYDDMVWAQKEADKIIAAQFYSHDCADELSALFADTIYDNFGDYLKNGKLMFLDLFNKEKIWESIKRIVFTPKVREQLLDIGVNVDITLKYKKEEYEKGGTRLAQWFFDVIRQRLWTKLNEVKKRTRKQYQRDVYIDLKKFSFLGKNYAKYAKGEEIAKDEQIKFSIPINILTRSAFEMNENWWQHKSTAVSGEQMDIRNLKKQASLRFFKFLYNSIDKEKTDKLKGEKADRARDFEELYGGIKKEKTNELKEEVKLSGKVSTAYRDYKSTLLEKMKDIFKAVTKVDENSSPILQGSSNSGGKRIKSVWNEYYRGMMSIIEEPWKWDWQEEEIEKWDSTGTKSSNRRYFYLADRPIKKSGRNIVYERMAYFVYLAAETKIKVENLRIY